MKALIPLILVLMAVHVVASKYHYVAQLVCTPKFTTKTENGMFSTDDYFYKGTFEVHLWRMDCGDQCKSGKLTELKAVVDGSNKSYTKLWLSQYSAGHLATTWQADVQFKNLEVRFSRSNKSDMSLPTVINHGQDDKGFRFKDKASSEDIRIPDRKTSDPAIAIYQFVDEKDNFFPFVKKLSETAFKKATDETKRDQIVYELAFVELQTITVPLGYENYPYGKIDSILFPSKLAEVKLENSVLTAGQFRFISRGSELTPVDWRESLCISCLKSFLPSISVVVEGDKASGCSNDSAKFSLQPLTQDISSETLFKSQTFQLRLSLVHEDDLRVFLDAENVQSVLKKVTEPFWFYPFVNNKDKVSLKAFWPSKTTVSNFLLDLTIKKLSVSKLAVSTFEKRLIESIKSIEKQQKVILGDVEAVELKNQITSFNSVKEQLLGALGGVKCLSSINYQGKSQTKADTLYHWSKFLEKSFDQTAFTKGQFSTIQQSKKIENSANLNIGKFDMCEQIGAIAIKFVKADSAYLCQIHELAHFKAFASIDYKNLPEDHPINSVLKASSLRSLVALLEQNYPESKSALKDLEQITDEKIQKSFLVEDYLRRIQSNEDSVTQSYKVSDFFIHSTSGQLAEICSGVKSKIENSLAAIKEIAYPDENEKEFWNALNYESVFDLLKKLYTASQIFQKVFRLELEINDRGIGLMADKIENFKAIKPSLACFDAFRSVFQKITEALRIEIGQKFAEGMNSISKDIGIKDSASDIKFTFASNYFMDTEDEKVIQAIKDLEESLSASAKPLEYEGSIETYITYSLGQVADYYNAKKDVSFVKLMQLLGTAIRAVKENNKLAGLREPVISFNKPPKELEQIVQLEYSKDANKPKELKMTIKHGSCNLLFARNLKGNSNDPIVLSGFTNRISFEDYESYQLSLFDSPELSQDADCGESVTIIFTGTVSNRGQISKLRVI